MNNEKLFAIAHLFDLEGVVAEIKPLGEGFINDTFIVRTEGDAPNYILQRKNHNVFPDVPGMMDNILAVTEHIKKKVADDIYNDVNRKMISYKKVQDVVVVFNEFEKTTTKKIKRFKVQ